MRFDVVERFAIPGCRISCYTFNENVNQFYGVNDGGFLDDGNNFGPASAGPNNDSNAQSKKEMGEQLLSLIHISEPTRPY